MNKYLSLHHFLFNKIGKLFNCRFLFLHPSAIGNASEELLFSLYRAQKEKKKIILIKPNFLIKILYPNNSTYSLNFIKNENLALEPDSIILSIVSFLFSIYFLIAKIMFALLRKILRLQANGYYWRPMFGQDLIWTPDSFNKFDWKLVEDFQWQNEIKKGLHIELNKKKFEKYENLELSKKLKDNWYVCLHVRDGGYKKDFKNIRNSNIENYFETIKYIISLGGYVIRMGDKTSNPINKVFLNECNGKLVDYPFENYNDPAFDIFLIFNCKYYIGTSSGILDTAWLFNKPVLTTNNPHWLNVLPLRKTDIGIFKKVYSKSKKKYLKISEWLDEFNLIRSEDYGSDDWKFEENNSEEIKKAFKEFIEINSSQFYLSSKVQINFKEKYKKTIKALSKNFKFAENNYENQIEWYRHGSRQINWQGNIANFFLEDNY
ncbi:TIGR04372 family glycosyltransferase [Candidatus Pelagibacter sp.]|uniref:TIGR04372 family glycosyltransferase n=1 Tax=Candidatus Pelagibacter sp. TaxID=2024849 RepID=UPI003D1291E4